MQHSSDTAEQKARLRKAMAEQKKQCFDSLKQRSEHCIRRLLAQPIWSETQVVMLYYSLSDEVSTHALADHLLAAGKIVLLPQVTGKTTMQLRQYTGRESLVVGAFGIMEPSGPVWASLSRIDVVIVPGVAFDEAGNRLGRGRGYYDRMLRQMPQARKIGLCFDFQRVAQVPIAETDVTMDAIVSESDVTIV